MRRRSRTQTIRALCVVVTLALAAGVVGGAPADGSSLDDCTNDTSWVPDSLADGETANDTEDVRVVVTYTNASVRASCGSALVSAVDGTVVGGEDVDIAPITVARVDPAGVDALESRPGVESVERDERVQRTRPVATDGPLVQSTATQSTPWGIDRVDARTAVGSVPEEAMRDVQVAVIDTGIDLDHPDLADNLVWGSDHVDGNDRAGLQYTDDLGTHGTHVAGTVAAADNDAGVVGVAPNVELYSIRTLDEDGTGYQSWTIAGLDSAIKGPDGELGTADDADVISMSLGAQDASSSYRDAIESASEHAVIVAAAGNGGDGDTSTNEVSYPARYPETIAVAATDRDDETTVFSAEGEQLDVAAPGKGILSTTNPDETGSMYGGFSGTSMATPHVSGIAALLIAQDLADGSRDRSPDEVRQRLIDTVVDIEADGFDKRSGHGLVDAAAALGNGDTDNPPTAAFTVSPSTPDVGESITFDASESTDDDGIESYDWTIAGENRTGAVQTRTFEDPGTYDVTLVVTDTSGQTNATTRAVTVGQDDPPEAAFTVSPSTPRVGETVTYNASASTDDFGIVSYNWTINGVDATGPVQTRQPTEAESHIVTLVVTDAAGQVDSVSRLVTIEPNAPPNASFTVSPSTPLVTETATFDANASTDDGGITNYNWTIDGVDATGPVQTRQFDDPGTYDVTLTVTDTSGVTNSTSRTVTVEPDDPPNASFTVSPSTPLVTETITLDANASTDDGAITGYNWTIAGENRTGAVQNVSFAEPGSYNVTLTVIDTADQTNTTRRSITVEPDQPPTAAFGVTPPAPRTNETIILDANTSTDDDGITGYNWTIAGENRTGAVQNVSFAETGSYNVTLTVTDTSNQTNTTRRSITVGATDSALPQIGNVTPRSLDDDPLLEDIDGDGRGSIFDALAYWNNRESPVITDNPQYFDFDGDGEAGTLFDTLALYRKISG